MNCLDKDKLLEWLAERLWNAESTAYNRVITEIESGRFDVEYGDAV